MAMRSCCGIFSSRRAAALSVSPLVHTVSKNTISFGCCEDDDDDDDDDDEEEVAEDLTLKSCLKCRVEDWVEGIIGQ